MIHVFKGKRATGGLRVTNLNKNNVFPMKPPGENRKREKSFLPNGKLSGGRGTRRGPETRNEEGRLRGEKTGASDQRKEKKVKHGVTHCQKSSQ